MKSFCLRLALLSLIIAQPLAAEQPLRVFIRSGPKSHAPGAHDYPQFLKDWVALLNERGAKATGKDGFPTKEELDNTDVLVLHAQEAGNIQIGEERKNLLEFTARGGGIVVVHAGVVSRDPGWFASLVGGSWNHQRPTKWLEAPMHLYFSDRENPITADMANFAMDDEIYYDMDVLPEARILAGAYTPKAHDTGGKGNKEAQARAAEAVAKKKGVNIYDIQPQVWSYEKDQYRAFVCIPGHWYKNFSHNTLRTLLLRGIAWAGKRSNANELCKPEELGDTLRYPEGGPIHPSKAAEKLEVHPEFTVSLVASEPLISKPINVDWDDKGRLWVCESPEYPNGRRELNVELWKDSGSWTKKYDRDPIDRISILSDQNGDGIMDSKKVFADKLELATSFCFHKNGVIVCAAPDIWYLEDTNNDEIADRRTKLYTGLGTRDTHAVINNLRWGVDGWIYATHGYSSGEVTALNAASKPPVMIGSGVCRFKPDGTEIEQYSSKGGNTWGLDITGDGQVFFTQPTSGTVFFHVVLPEYVLAKGKLPGTNSWHGMISGQNSYPLMSWPEQAYVQIDLVGQFTAAAGCTIYEGGAWPRKWDYSYFTTEPTLNIVHHQFVKRDGITYRTEKEKGREETEFIRSRDLWFRPIETRIGPDDALYVLDFYNQAVIHNDTRGPIHGPANAAVRPDRDHYYGRIWKVNHKDAKKVSPATARTRLANSNEPSGSEAYKTYQAIAKVGIPEALAAYSSAADDWTRSAIVAATAGRARETLIATLKSASGVQLLSLVNGLLPSIAEQPEAAAALVEACSNSSSDANKLKIALLQGIGQHLKEPLPLSSTVTESLKKLLAQPALAPATLPLVVKWDKANLLAEVVTTQLSKLSSTLANKSSPVADRVAAIQALVSIGSAQARAEVAAILTEPDVPEALQQEIITGLGDSGGASELVSVMTQLKPHLMTQAFDAILKRPQATLALLTSLQDGKVDPALLGPGNLARLRTHPNKQVAKRANAMIDKLSPNAKAKNELIAQYTPIVEQPGDAVKGKVLFSAACAICHKLGDVGKDVAPPLVGMGAHGPAELLIHVIDPNREVDPSFYSWNITKKNGETLAGIIASENAASVTLRNQAGDFEVKKDDIKERVNTRLSLMPEGLEGLGAENIRDILAFVCGDAQKHFRVLHLTESFTADSREGIFKGTKPNEGQVRLSKYGNVTVEEIPFFIQDAGKSSTGANLIVLKGGPKDAHSQSFPSKVEVPIQVEAKRLHLLSGISGWGFPAVKDHHIALQATVIYANGEQEVFALKNGVEFADYIRPVEVPGSQYVEGLTDGQQMRLLTLKLTKKSFAKTLILESPNDNHTVPVIVAITADLEGRAEAKTGVGQKPQQTSMESGPKEGGRGDGPLAPSTPVQWEAGKTKVLVIGGGSSHNFAEFFGKADLATLKAAGFTAHYTEDRDQAAGELANADVAIISVNRKFFDTPAYRKAVMDFAAAGKGIIMLHPGTWYGFASWPELNAQIVGGGSRGHDKIHPFDVKVVKPEHPVMAGVPTSFSVVDELYYMNADPANIPAGTAPIEVLAETSPSDKFKAPHPSIWVTQHPKAKIVGIAIGHDERTHEHEAFKKVLCNAVQWTSGEKK